jgi:hypothetical protein
VFLASFGSGSAQAAVNPFQQIIDLLQQINGKLHGTVDLCNGGSTVGRFVNIGTTEVCDRKTGLTWQKTPDAGAAAKTYDEAVAWCLIPTATVAAGSRLPQVSELASLVDYSQLNPALPLGHPFIIGIPSIWSATTLLDLPTAAWHVYFGNGYVTNNPKTNPISVWCVR